MTSTDMNTSPALKTRQSRHLMILGGLTVITVIAAIYTVVSSREAVTSQFEPFVFFPDLEKQVEENIAEVAITSKDDGVVRLVLNDSRSKWTAPDKHGFPVKTDELRGILISLLEAEAVEAKTARADWHDLLGLEDPTADGNGIKVEVKDKAGNAFADLIIGDNVGFGAVGSEGARYVRRVNEDQTYVARGDLAVKTDINEWIVRDVVDLFRERVAKVTIEPTDGPAYVLSRATTEDANFALANIPDGREVLSDTAPNQLGSALANVKFDDVRPAADFDFSKGAQLSYETFDGLKISIAALKLGEDHWISVSGELLPAPADGASGEAEESEAPDAASGLKSREDVEAEAAGIASSTSGWAYQVPSWKGDVFQRDLESLLKPLDSDTDGAVEDAP